MIAAPFEYEAPATVEDAVRLLSELGDRGRVLAGGHSLIPLKPAPGPAGGAGGHRAHRGPAGGAGGRRLAMAIGALTTHTQVMADDAVRRECRCWRRRPP